MNKTYAYSYLQKYIPPLTKVYKNSRVYKRPRKDHILKYDYYSEYFLELWELLKEHPYLLTFSMVSIEKDIHVGEAIFFWNVTYNTKYKIDCLIKEEKIKKMFQSLVPYHKKHKTISIIDKVTSLYETMFLLDASQEDIEQYKSHMKKYLVVNGSHLYDYLCKHFEVHVYKCEIAMEENVWFVCKQGIGCEDLPSHDIKKEVKYTEEEQLLHSISYAKKYELEIFYTDFQKYRQMLLQYMKEEFQPYVYSFQKGGTHIPIGNDFFKNIEHKIHVVTHYIDAYYIENYHKITFEIGFYNFKYKLKKEVEDILQHPISQAWLKMYEILHDFSFFEGKQTIETFHFCELPGNFIHAMQYYIDKNEKIQDIDIDIHAQSLHPDLADIGNMYGYLEKEPDMWNFGNDNTGNITKVDNIKYYKEHYTPEFITSDCGLPYTIEFERYYFVQFAQMYAILSVLQEGGDCIFKMKVPIQYPYQFTMLYFFYLHFDLYFYKGVQNYQSMEFYVIGKNYKKISEEDEKKIEENMKSFQKEWSLFEVYEENFVKGLQESIEHLAHVFIREINRRLFYTRYFLEGKQENKDLIEEIIKEKNQEWLKKYHFI